MDARAARLIAACSCSSRVLAVGLSKRLQAAAATGMRVCQVGHHQQLPHRMGLRQNGTEA